MQYKNPIIPGFYPDPSICTDGKSYYLVCSSFNYFPGVPLFKSDDLINWEAIGSVLTRNSQLPLHGAGNGGGIYAPTIRYNEGRFYMVTTNVSSGGNFYVYTDDIYGEWSEPIWVEQGGIDPSLYFEDGKAYFMSNGADDDGVEGITQCEIDIETGEKLSKSKCIWQGAGGRYLESPHLYKINGTYYLMAAEGGTEYGHMVVCARSNSIYGPYENNPANPILTNRNLGGYRIQGCGHADLIQDKNGNWWMVHLAFRQTGLWSMYHTTGREVYMVPVTFADDGWFVAGENGTTPEIVTTDRLPKINQQNEIEYTFENAKPGKEFVFVRNPDMENYTFSDKKICIKAGQTTLSDAEGSPGFVAIRQQHMDGFVSCLVNLTAVEQNSEGTSEAGLSVYMNEWHHYDLAVVREDEKSKIIKRLCVGDIQYVQESIDVESPEKDIRLDISFTPDYYSFKMINEGKEYNLCTAQSKYVSTEVAGGFTGVMIGLYAVSEQKNVTAEFSEFKAIFRED